MFKHSSSSLSLSIALFLVYSITIQGFAHAMGMIVSSKTVELEKSASTDVQREGGTGVSPMCFCESERTGETPVPLPAGRKSRP